MYIVCNYELVLFMDEKMLRVEMNNTQTFGKFTSFLAFATQLTVALSDRSSLSILTVPNAYLTNDDHISCLPSLTSWFNLRPLPPPPSGKVITMLPQTTGRATDNFGFVNLTRDSQFGVISIHSPTPYSPYHATILSFNI
ncbi:hypothetical protein GmHk_11G032650 [Glycine max]|nr:hypothetical protein GmHk_11G032650 [Glycine max]KAH1225830.1 hypothetical protein GmHk_11G032650 [Glycine max]